MKTIAKFILLLAIAVIWLGLEYYARIIPCNGSLVIADCSFFYVIFIPPLLLSLPVYFLVIKLYKNQSQSRWRFLFLELFSLILFIVLIWLFPWILFGPFWELRRLFI